MSAAVGQEKVIRIRFEPVGPGVQTINNQLRSIVAAGGGANTSLAQLSSQLNNVGGSATRMGGNLVAANNNTRLLGSALGTLSGTTGAAATALGQFNGVLGSLVLAGATAGVLALAGALAFAVSTSNGYADQLANISTLVDTATFNMGALSAGLKEQAVLFGADPVAQAAASYDIISSGASSAADAIATLNSANMLAAVGATNVAVAANGLTSVINAWAGSNLTATDAADSMFVTVRDGKISMEQLSASIGNVAPLAATLGLSLDDVGASIAALTLGGVGGSEAVTNIRAALTAVIKPSSEASKLAKQLGLDFSSAALKAKGWPAFLKDVADKTHGSQDSLAILMGGTEALSGVLALTTTAAGSFSNSLDNMKNKAGDAADGLKKIQDASPTFQLQRVWAAIKVAALDIGQSITAVLVPALRFVADHFLQAVAASKVLLATFVAYKAVSFAASVIQGATALGTLASAANALNAVISVATKAQAIFNMVVLANPYAAVAAAIVLVVGLLYEFSDAISLGGGNVASLGDLFREVWASIVPMISAASDAMSSFFSSIGSGLSSALGGVGSFLADAFSGPIVMLKSVWADAFGDLDFSISGVLIGAARVADGLVGLFRGSMNVLKVIWAEAPGALWNSFSPGFQSVLTGGKNLVTGIAKAIGTLISSIASFGAGAISTVVSVYNSIAGFIERMTNKIIGLLNKAIAGANVLGAGLKPLAEVKVGTIEPPKPATSEWTKLGGDIGTAWKSGFGNEAEGAVRGLLGRANARHNAGGAEAPSVTKPATPAGAGAGLTKPDAGKKNNDAENRAKQEKEFWKTLEDQVATAKLFGLELAKHTEEQKLQKILGTELSKGQKERVDNLVQQVATEKALTSIRQSAFELGNKHAILSQRAKGLTEDQLKIEEAIDAERIKALNSGLTLADINGDAFKVELDKLRVILQQNANLEKQGALIKQGTEFAKKFSQGFDTSFDIKELEDSKANFLKQFDAGEIKDALGRPISTATRDAILSGADQAIAELKNKPLELIARVSPVVAQRLEVGRVQAEHAQRLGVLNDPTAAFTKAEREQAIRDEAEFFRVEMAKATSIVADEFLNKFSGAIDGLANIFDIFSKKLGTAIRGLSDAVRNIRDMGDANNPTNQLMQMLGSKISSGFNDSIKSMSNWKSGLDNIGKPLEGLKKAFGKGGDAVKGIGQAVGGAMAGYQIGDSIGGLMESIGMKGSGTGAKIGGTLGGLTGNPVIAAVGSVVGGVIGSLLYKPKFGTASLTGPGDASITGNKSGNRAAAGSAAGAVQAGLADIASKLGGTVGAFSLAIGQWDGKWRVNDDATNKQLHSKNFGPSTLHDFGDNAEAAVAYAIQNAIKDGAITGIAAWLSNALQSVGPDAAASILESFTNMTAELNAMLDPIGSAARDIINPINQLVDTMKQYGATAEDVAKLEQYKSLKLAEGLKNQLSSLTGFLDALKGEGSGVTKVSRLTDDMSKFASMQADIAAGKTIDQDAFTALGQEIFGLARDIYGTSTSQFQDIRSSLLAATTDLSGNITAAFNSAAGISPVVGIDATSAAIQSASDAQVAATRAQTDAVTAELSIQTDYIRQLVANGSFEGKYSDNLSAKLATMNGEYTGLRY